MKRKRLVLFFSCIIFSIVLLSICFFLYFNMNKKKDVDNVLSLERYIGDEIPTVDDFFSTKKEKGSLKLYYDDWLVESNTFNEVGVYKAVISVFDKVYHSTITVKDLEKPVLKLKDVTILVGDDYNPLSFVVSCRDNSNRKCTFEFSDKEMYNYKDKGTYDIDIIAKDESFNTTRSRAKLTIVDQLEPEVNNELTLENGTDLTLEEVIKEEYKFGVKITNKTSICYELSNDGSKKRIRSKNEILYDRSSFNAKTEELLLESKNFILESKEDREKLFDLINEHRKNEGVSNLQLSNQLSDAATVRSLEMAWSGNFSHTRPNGKSAYTISNDFSFDFKILGENIAKGIVDSKDVINYWKDSLGSYKNIVNLKYKYVGIGVVEVSNVKYWTLLFG